MNASDCVVHVRCAALLAAVSTFGCATASLDRERTPIPCHEPTEASALVKVRNTLPGLEIVPRLLTGLQIQGDQGTSQHTVLVLLYRASTDFKAEYLENSIVAEGDIAPVSAQMVGVGVGWGISLRGDNTRGPTMFHHEGPREVVCAGGYLTDVEPVVVRPLPVELDLPGSKWGALWFMFPSLDLSKLRGFSVGDIHVEYQGNRR